MRCYEKHCAANNKSRSQLCVVLECRLGETQQEAPGASGSDQCGRPEYEEEDRNCSENRLGGY